MFYYLVYAIEAHYKMDVMDAIRARSWYFYWIVEIFYNGQIRQAQIYFSVKVLYSFSDILYKNELSQSVPVEHKPLILAVYCIVLVGAIVIVISQR